MAEYGKSVDDWKPQSGTIIYTVTDTGEIVKSHHVHYLQGIR